MVDAAVLLLKLLIVQQIETSETSTTLHFQTGTSGVLSADNKHYGYYLTLAQRSQSRQHPVGVAIDESGDILEISRADSDLVAKLAPGEEGRIDIFFQGHDGKFHLAKNHPEFDHLSEMLKRSLNEEKRVWFAARKPHLAVTDLMWFEETDAPMK